MNKTCFFASSNIPGKMFWPSLKKEVNSKTTGKSKIPFLLIELKKKKKQLLKTSRYETRLLCLEEYLIKLYLGFHSSFPGTVMNVKLITAIVLKSLKKLLYLCCRKRRLFGISAHPDSKKVRLSCLFRF